ARVPAVAVHLDPCCAPLVASDKTPVGRKKNTPGPPVNNLHLPVLPAIARAKSDQLRRSASGHSHNGQTIFPVKKPQPGGGCFHDGGFHPWKTFHWQRQGLPGLPLIPGVKYHTGFIQDITFTGG